MTAERWNEGIRRGTEMERHTSEANLAELEGRFDDAERVWKSLDRPSVWRNLLMLYVHAEKWEEAQEVLGTKGGEPGVQYGLVPYAASIVRYGLGDRAGGDAVAPHETVDCGVWYTWDRDAQEGDEGPNKPVLDSTRKREAAAWHGLAVEQSKLGSDLAKKRCLVFAEKAARMFPDEPAFSYVYARALDSSGYATGALEQYERSVRNGRGYFVGTLDETIRVARFHAGKPYDRGRRP
ncbi:MAG: hypothetical protein IT207_03730 [Fimbriimonadaceae bacterium]|nr:hypothetical protein [Fimbriimonadaceae bacterium]